MLRHLEMARPEVDIDLVDVGEFEQMRLRLLGQIEQRLGAVKAVFGLQVLSPGALAGAELAAIAARRTITEPMRLDQHDIGAGLCQMHCRRQACKAAADNDDVACPIAVERRVLRPAPTVSSYQE